MVKKIIITVNHIVINILGRTPLKDIPHSLENDYTMRGKIPIKKWYFNQNYISLLPRIYTKKIVEFYKQKVIEKKSCSYKNTDRFLYQALDKYSIDDKKVVVFGSTQPFYEAMALSYGAKNVTILEYNNILSFHPQIQALTYKQYEKNKEKFDIGFSISSFEHDGLGRYGDPLKPNGDIEAMNKAKSILKHKGILFLAVPVGKDTIFWNAHRMYGRIRLPLLLEGWEIIDHFGFNEKQFEKEIKPKEDHDQPVFVLKNV